MATTRKRTALDWYFGPWILRHLGIDYPERPTLEVIPGAGITLTPVDDPTGDATQLTISADGAGTTVLDDIAKHSGTAIDTVQGIQGIPLSGYTRGTPPTIIGAVATYNAVGTPSYKSKKPSPPGWYDVTDYGLVGDGTTDNLAKMNALLASIPFTTPGTVYFPPGKYRFSDYLRTPRPLCFRGAGSSFLDGAASSILMFDAGKGMIVEFDGMTPVDGGGSQSSLVEQLQFYGAMLSLGAHATSHAYALGALIATPRLDDNRYFFECILAGTSASSAPDYRNAYLVDDSITRQASLLVPRGHAVRDTAVSTAVFFLCTTAGTTSSTAGAAPPGGWNTTLGATTTDGTAVYTAASAAGRWIQDGTAWFRCSQGSGLFMRARTSVRDCSFYSFTNFGTLIAASGTWTPGNNANGWEIRHCVYDHNGGGIAVRGEDANAGCALDCDVSNCGDQWTGALTSTGGHGYWDGSFLGNTWIGCQEASGSGRPYFVGKYDQGAADEPCYGTLIGCYSEGASLASYANLGTVIIGGDHGAGWDPAGLGMRINGANWVNFQYVEPSSAKHLEVQFAPPGTDQVISIGNDDNPTPTYFRTMAAYESSLVGRAGWWFDTYGAFCATAGVSGITATEGAGWAWDFFGKFKGGAQGAFSGQYFCGYDLATLNSPRVRKVGHFLVGDRFDLQDDGVPGTWTGYVVKTAGYRGPHWSASVAAQAGGTGVFQISIVEPTANATPIPAPGGQVWKCTTTGTTGSSEPSWPGSPTAGVTTVTDGTVVWTFLGNIPQYTRLGFVDDPVTGKTPQTRLDWEDSEDTDLSTAAAKAAVRSRRICTSTTTATANQVLASIPINDNTVSVIDVVVCGKSPAGDNATSCKLSGSFVRSGGTIERMGSDDVGTVKWKGFGIGTTHDLNINGAVIEVRASPNATGLNQWIIIAQISEGKD